MSREAGLTLPELLLTVAIIGTVTAIGLPVTADAIDAHRTASAARYLAGRINLARMEAVKRSADVGLKFEDVGGDYAFAEYVDGNDNGIRTLDIRAGIDPLLLDPERLGDNFSGVRFGLMPGIPDADGVPDRNGGDGVRIGSSRILTLGPNGTATAGTLYLHGRRLQFAVRVFGVTGRTRVLRYNAAARKWMV
jgi:prepilin-type N-terminal cleavage/methylation domain-containing protein